jgi:hypothetical protein
MPIDYTKLRNLTARDLTSALIKDGFSLRRQKGVINATVTRMGEG